MIRYHFTLAVLFFASIAWASPLNPLKLETPRDTMTSFYQAMNDYRKGLETGDENLKRRIHDAARCLDLSKVTPVLQKEMGKKTAIYLKEVMDRVIVLDFSKVPDQSDLARWRLKDTEITIYKINDESERNGLYLFSPDTILRAENDYKTVKHLPYLAGSGGGAGYHEPLLDGVVPDWAREKSLGLSNWQWIGIILAIFAGILLKILAEFAVVVMKKLTTKIEGSLRHQTILALEKPIGLIVATGFWFAIIFLLKLEGNAQVICLVAVKLTFSVSLIWASYNLCSVVTNYLKIITDRTENTLDDHLVPLASKGMKIFVIVFGSLMAVQSLGFNVMSLMAGLGLGGLAFALAAKDTAANLFGSIMILIDRPFLVGDWVRVGSTEGNVEEIGFRSTRVRTFYNSLVSIPNMEMASKAIDNMGARKLRRENVTIGVTYDTSPEKIEGFMDGIKNIILANTKSNKENFHVAFRGFGSSSLNIMLYYFVDVKDWGEELMEKQHINLEIMRLAKKLNISFAFPTQSLYIEGLPEKPLLNPPIEHERESLQKASKDFGPNGELSQPSGLGIFNPPYNN